MNKTQLQYTAFYTKIVLYFLEMNISECIDKAGKNSWDQLKKMMKKMNGSGLLFSTNVVKKTNQLPGH